LLGDSALSVDKMALEKPQQIDIKYKRRIESNREYKRRYRLRHAIFDTFKNGQLCECGCGKEVKPGKRFIYGHNGKKDFSSFEKARNNVRSLGIKNSREYKRLHKHGKLPKGIPFAPHQTYKNKGWVSWPDYLGNGFREFLPFEEVKEEIQKLDTHSEDEYVRLHKEGKLPKGMPRYPADLYKNKGWISWYDFLGYKKFDWLSYEDAKKIVQKLKIPNGETFGILHTEGKIPKGIPATPHDVYKNKGWNGWPDFLGNENNIVYNTKRKLLPFKEARNIVRSLGIESEKEYRRLGKQGKLPEGLPANPQLVYRKKV
jgi:hypothetical protein